MTHIPAAGQRLRIAVLNRLFRPTGGGAERYSMALVEQLAQRHEIHVFAQQIDHRWPGVSYHRVSAPLTKPRWINQIWYAVATWWATRRGFDVVHSHENTWHGQVQTVHVLPVKYNLFHGRTGWRLALRWFKVLTSPRLLVYLWLEHMRYAAAPGRQIVATSNSLRAIMCASYPHTSAYLGVVTPGVDAVPGLPNAAEKLAARLSLGLPEDRPCILFVGNDYRKKGLPALLAALGHLPAEVVLAVVGNPAHIPAFREPANAAGLAQRVFFLGALKDMTPAYRAADCLAHPTLEDTFAMVVLEAMAHGLPVVVSKESYCGIVGLLTPGVNALILQNPQDAQVLADTLQEVLQDERRRQRMSDEAAAFARSHQWSQVAVQQEQIYRLAVAGH
ncbi:MAG: glycosyltransferase family 4 protein [Hylemonella sp.]|nr:glycosyltransferase family 4 protein [Hylemonella sp.]